MSPTPRARLEGLARRWRRRRALGYALVALAAGLAVGVGSGALPGWGVPLRLALAAAASLGIGLAALRRARRQPVSAASVARHLDRAIPALEDSATLLLADEASLGTVARLQRRRAAEALAAAEPLPPLPQRSFARAVALAAGLGLATLALAWLAPRSPLASAGSAARPTLAPLRPTARPAPRVERLTLSIRPPAYTGRPVRDDAPLDATAEEGATLTWRLATDRPVARARLVTTEGDSVAFALAPGADRAGAATATLRAARPLLWQVVLEDSAGAAFASEYHALTVTPDAAPAIAVRAPAARTTIAAGAPPLVDVDVLARDDYGVRAARIVATVTTGKGEGVKFQERTLPFTSVARRGAGTLALRTRLDLRALGLGPGDELYFYVAATDTRAPVPNEGRSPTLFAALADTGAAPVADLAGLAAGRLPAAFRSQRQIILDTERLLRERARLARAEVARRANEIGADQALLRLRYGELLGGEHVESGAEGALEHAHDTEENATLLADAVKRKLTAAVDQMFQAERALRGGEPAAALPFEYRALARLKEAQQATRVYVQRIGYAPPPLEPARTRLSGELKGIAPASAARDVVVPDSLAALRAALPLLERLRAGAPLDDAARGGLDAAGHALARLAVAEPGRHLATLRALRALAAAPSVARCPGCLDAVARGLATALPVPAPRPIADPASADRRTGLARAYLDELRRAR
ncbi:MAG TPA: hypothetical protein VFS40_07920 [Gemmatimonadales bacterium]|nr:hypothetical protein [Gemmatimonadales bacterium]